MTEAATDFQMSLDYVSVDPEMTREFPNRPTLGVENGQEKMILISQFGLRAPSHIHRGGDRFDVCRIHARSHATQMVGLETLGPGTNSLFPDGAMRDHLSPPEHNLPVSLLSDSGALPHPARSCKSAILNREVPIVDEASALTHGEFPPAILVSADEASRLTSDVSTTLDAVGGNRGRLPASALTQLDCHKDASYHHTPYGKAVGT